MKLIRAHECEEAVALVLDEWSPDDPARGEALAYLLAARLPAPPGSDDRIPVPDFIANFAPSTRSDNQEAS